MIEDIEMDRVRVAGKVLERPAWVPRSRWMDFWERSSQLEWALNKGRQS